MASLSTRQIASGTSIRCSVRPVVARPSALVRAVEQETQQSTPATFAPSAQQAEGYVEKDTAGQSNMYPTITRPFEAGAADATSKAAESDTRMLAGGAGAIAGLLVVAGLAALAAGSGQKEATGEYLTLSAYQAKFASELGIPKSAPAPAPAPALEVVEAPAVQSEVVAVEAASE